MWYGRISARWGAGKAGKKPFILTAFVRLLAHQAVGEIVSAEH